MELLFYKQGSLSEFLRGQHWELTKEIEGFARDYILNANEADLHAYLTNKYTLDVPNLRKDDIYALEPKEVKVDVSRDPTRVFFSDGSPTYVNGTSITIIVPYAGNESLFNYSPSTYTLNPPRGIVRRGELHFYYQSTDHNVERVRSEFDRNLQQIEQYLAYVNQDVSIYNSTISSTTFQIIQQRKTKLLEDMNMAGTIGFPIKRREDAPTTYSVPSVQRKPQITRPIVKDNQFKPEPTLDLKEYDNILEIIQNMVHVMERSPSAFTHIDEESLREHFLVQLNGQYEGQATGETFNYEGKTDILIRADGRNIFIAECKFWKGEKVFRETIDQLLGYLSWRDTKTALLIFNRNKGFSSVVQKIPLLVEAHPNFKRSLGKVNESQYRYVFKQRDDPNREIILTVMAFLHNKNKPAVFLKAGFYICKSFNHHHLYKLIFS
jgi:hypothetical protein